LSLSVSLSASLPLLNLTVRRQISPSGPLAPPLSAKFAMCSPVYLGVIGVCAGAKGCERGGDGNNMRNSSLKSTLLRYSPSQPPLSRT